MELEKAKEVIKKMDEHFLERRAKRFLRTEDMRSVVGIPEEIQSMLLEGLDCFLYLKDSACVVISSGSLELALKMKFVEDEEKYSDYRFYQLIEIAKKSKLFNDRDTQVAHEIRVYRNVYVHADLKEQYEHAQIMQIKIENPDGLVMGEGEIERVKKIYQLMEIKPEHARVCLLNSYNLIRKLYPSPEET